MTAAQEIARFACQFGDDDLTPDLVQACGRALVDTYCAAIAGRNEPASERALRYARAQGQSSGLQAAHWGTGELLPLELAALCNGIAGHVLDYDDVTSPLRGHPSVAMLPALLGLAEAIDADGRDLVSAYVVGFEVICKLSHVMAVDHYARGWHSTSTIGCLGAAVACSRLLKLGPEQTAHAIGLVVAQAAGSRANFGTDAKSFQAGHSNASSLRATLMAREGFESSANILEAPFGYLELYGNAEPLIASLSALGQGPLELIRSGIEVKKYPLCYATHRALDGMLDVRQQWGLQLGDVQSVHVRASKGALTPLIHTRPQTGLEAKFSMQYAMAAALLDGQVGLASFTNEAVQRPQAQAFLARVTSDDSGSGPTFPRWTEIELSLHDGRGIHKRIDALRGSAQFPLTLNELRDKARDCLAWGGAHGDVDGLIDRAMHLDRIPARQWREAAQLKFTSKETTCH